MNKLFLGAIAAMTLAACSQEDIETQSVKKSVNAIDFNVSTRNNTRVAESFSSTNLPSSINIWALKSDNSAYINGEAITKQSDGSYATATEHAWPGETLNFFATVNGTPTFTDGTAAIKDFTVGSDAANQVDLLYASTPNLTSGTVGINLKHALSQVCFKAQNTNSKISVKVKSVGVGYISNKGTYTLPSTSEATGEWAIASDAVSTEYTVTLSSESEVTLTKTAQSLGYGESDPSGILSLIPQQQSRLTIADGTSSIASMTKDGAYFVINATVTSTSDSYELYSGNIYVPVSINWAQGNRYIYTLSFADCDGGYRDNGKVLFNGTISYSVACADYVDKEVNNEMTSSTKVTTTLTPNYDAWIRSDNTTIYNSDVNLQTKSYTNDEDATQNRYFYGLMSFDGIPEEALDDNHVIKSAKLILVTERIKGIASQGVAIYKSQAFDSSTKYTDLSTTIDGLSTTTDKIQFSAAGPFNKALGLDDISGYTDISVWTNTIDITDQLKSFLTDGNLYLLIGSTANVSNEVRFFSSKATDVTNSKDNSITFSASDLQPRLVIEYDLK